MSKIKTDGLDQYGAEPFEWHQFETAAVEGINDSKLVYQWQMLSTTVIEFLAQLAELFV